MLTKPLVALNARLRLEEGQGLAEYGLLLALIAVVCLIAVTALGVAISGNLGTVTAAL